MVDETDIKEEILALTADIVSAFVSNNSVRSSELPDLISSIHGQLSSLSKSGVEIETPSVPLVPAVALRKSVADNEITCLECGKRFKSLKRHLMTHHSLTPEEYRARWELPATYPMVAPAYAAARSELAKTMGLGRKPGQAASKK